MKKVIKVIDLLNMIAKGEIKDKQRFRVTIENNLTRDIYYDASEGCNICCFKHCSDDFWWTDEFNLNDEVEILDEEDEIDIQKINEEDLIIMHETRTGENYSHSISVINKKIMNTINNLIDEVEKLNKLESNT